ncbi:MAG: tRNA (adenosine(37)-N6)-threonylcarbamoyltransferase complex ATPase subunit type 1 TsaE [Halobacteriovoraceae bacterium]|nr:tRNA (adenosine(37)-N6)-threonylcarbamoyltransferase complex ATPase subunit type 1 TsaE [Halobacteriovoraceae bacterium]
MHKKLIKEWKKAYENDYSYIVSEIKADVEGPSVIFLEGPLGAGKTTLARYFSGDSVLSPTYSIICELDDMIHADFYRLESVDEIIHLDLPTYLEQKEFFLAEWGGKFFRQLVNYVPDHFFYYMLEIIINDENNPNIRDLKFYSIDPLLS